MKKIKNGTRRFENGWIRVTVKGTPYQIGYSNGALLATEMKEIFKMLDFSLFDTYGFDRSFFADVISTLFRSQIENRFPEYFEEMKGITDGVNDRGVKLTLNDIILWNCYYSLGYMISYLPDLINENSYLKKTYGHLFEKNKKMDISGGARDRCTGFIAVGNWTKDGKIVCGHNTFDNFLDSQYCNVILEIQPQKGNTIIMQTAPGSISSGTDYFVTSAGIICTETTIGGFSKFILRDPICCRSRKAMQYGKTLDECKDILIERNSGDYANSWLLGDTRTNTIMRIELGLDYIKIEKKKNGYFIGYNAPTDPRIRNLECSNTGFYDIRRHSGARRVRLTQLMKEYKGKLDVEIGQKILADHYDVYLNKINPCSRTCCSHYNLDDRAFMSDPSRPKPFQPHGALDGIVTDTKLAKNMSLVGRWGSSCGTPFNAKEFCTLNIQWAHQEPYLKDRPQVPWTIFTCEKRRKKYSRKNSIAKKNSTIKK